MPVLLFNGYNDWMVYTKAMEELQKQLRVFKNDGYSNFTTGAAHVWSLDSGTCKCGECAIKNSTPECCNVNNCGYDLSGDLFGRFYGKVAAPGTAQNKYYWVNQLEYLPNRSGQHQLEEYGFAYVPTGCEVDPDSCKVHVHYHGCMNRNWTERLRWSN